MYTPAEMKALKIRNHGKLKLLIRCSYAIGINITSQTLVKQLCKLLNIFIMISCTTSLYAHWLQIERADGDMPLIAETSTTALQATTGIVKMAYCLFVEQKFHVLMQRIESHELLQKMEIFLTDYPIKEQLKQEINKIMDKSWHEIRRQLGFCVVCNYSAMCNYFFTSLFKNLYHDIKGTPDYVYALPFTGYPMFLRDQKSYFWYSLDMFLGASSIWVAGATAISFHCIFMVFAKHGCALIQVLCKLLENSTSPLLPQQRRTQYLRCCVIQHKRIIDYLNEVNVLYKHITLSQFLHSLAIYGFVLFVMNFGLESNKVTFVRMIMYFLAAFYVDCMYYVNGQFLGNELEKIPYACYTCDWYKESKEFKKILVMIISRSNKIFYFEISWFAVMSLATLMGIMKASISYFLLLRDIESPES